MDEVKTYVTVAELSGLISVRQSTLALWRRRGDGPRHFLSGDGQIIYRIQDVKDWQDSCVPSPTSEYLERIRIQAAATKQFSDALRCGAIVPVGRCEICGKEGKTHGHHQDYSQPLTVNWLCQRCHNYVHTCVRALARIAS